MRLEPHPWLQRPERRLFEIEAGALSKALLQHSERLPQRLVGEDAADAQLSSIPQLSTE